MSEDGARTTVTLVFCASCRDMARRENVLRCPKHGFVCEECAVKYFWCERCEDYIKIEEPKP